MEVDRGFVFGGNGFGVIFDWYIGDKDFGFICDASDGGDGCDGFDVCDCCNCCGGAVQVPPPPPPTLTVSNAVLNLFLNILWNLY